MHTLARSVLALALLLAALPGASAHGGIDEGAWLGDSSIHFRLVGAPLVAAGAPLRIEIAAETPRAIEARLEAPTSGERPWFPLRAEGALQVADVTFSEAGAWRVHVRSGADVASFEVDVWPAGRAFVEPAGEAGARGVVVQGRGEPLAVQLVDAQHAPIAPPADATARIAGPAGVETRPLVARDGLLVLEHAWAQAGPHEIEVLSQEAGLAQGARPPHAVLVVPESDAGVYGLEEREVPWGLLALPALGLALALRQLTRARP